MSYLAAITSCCITYWVIRIIGGDALRKLESPFAQKILAKLDSNPIKTIILLRTFFQTAHALNYTLALSGINFQKDLDLLADWINKNKMLLNIDKCKILHFSKSKTLLTCS